MKLLRTGVVVMMFLMVAAPRVRADAALDSLFASEKAFAAMASEKSVRSAFLTFMAEDAVVFEPTAVNARKVWEARPESKAKLLWEPAYAQVSSAGDLGFSTGPWEFRPAPDSSATPAAPDSSATAAPADSSGTPAAPADSSGTPAAPAPAPAPPTSTAGYAYGQFNSVWKKMGDVWRVVLDIGVTHPRPMRSGVGSGEFEPGVDLPRRTMKSGRVKMASLDEKLSKEMRKSGGGPGFAMHAAENVRLNTDGRLPAKGLENAQARVDSLVGFFEFTSQGSGLAKSGDLGYTYGTAVRFPSEKATPADTSVYLHVWRQQGSEWQIALAVWNRLGAR